MPRTNDMYLKMKSKGIDMSWYEKSKGDGIEPGKIPLEVSHCSRLSIYVIDKLGQMSTITNDGRAYAVVRFNMPHRDQDTFVCMHCKEQWDNFAEAINHKEIINA